MQKCVVSSESDVAGFLLHHQLFVTFLSLCLNGFFIGGKIDLSIGIEKQIAFHKIGLQILHHGVLSFSIVYFFFRFLWPKVDRLSENRMLHKILPRYSGVSIYR